MEGGMRRLRFGNINQKRIFMHPVLFTNSHYPLSVTTHSPNLLQTSKSHPIHELSSIPYSECVDLVFSRRFLDFLDSDRENPCVTAVAKTADKLTELIGNFLNAIRIGSREKIEVKKESNHVKASDDFSKYDALRIKRDTAGTETVHVDYSQCFSYRKGPHFLHRPPFFNKDAPGSCVCKEISYQYPFIADKIKSSQFFYGWLTLGKGESCKIFKVQEKCLKSTLHKFFDPNSKFNNALLLFADNSNKLPLEPFFGQVSQSSEILPLNFTFSYWTSKKLSPEFIYELSAEFKNFRACEKEADKKEKLVTGGYALAIALMVTGVGIGVFKYYRNPDIDLLKDPTNDLEYVTIHNQNYRTFKNN